MSEITRGKQNGEEGETLFFGSKDEAVEYFQNEVLGGKKLESMSAGDRRAMEGFLNEIRDRLIQPVPNKERYAAQFILHDNVDVWCLAL